jgi:hypothetical protein
MGGFFGGGGSKPVVPAAPPPPPPVPTRDDAREQLDTRDKMRARRGRAATMLAEDTGPATTGTKTLLGT